MQVLPTSLPRRWTDAKYGILYGGQEPGIAGYTGHAREGAENRSIFLIPLQVPNIDILLIIVNCKHMNNFREV